MAHRDQESSAELQAGSDGGGGPSEAHPQVSEHVFHILLSLVDRPRHGYGILLEVEERSGGAMVLGTGTLYSAIKRLRRDGWIEETEAPQEADDDPRRRYYCLTPKGLRVVRVEAARLQSMVRQARAKAVLPGEAVS